MNFLTELMDSTSELETPRSFWYWAGLATISAVVKDNIWLPRGQQVDSTNAVYNLYPNIYVMLHADSGLKKGPPVGLAKKLVKAVNNTRIISGRSSIQGMLKELGTAYTMPGGKVMSKSVAFIVASEFSSSIVEDKAAMTILTDLYDRHYNEGEWKSLLKMEQFQLKDPTVSLLVATNEAHFEDFVQQKDVHGGFIGRMFVIAERETNALNPLIKRLNRVPDEKALTNMLKTIAMLQGPFADLDKTAAGEMYEEWYYKFYETVRSEKIKDDTGTIQRFGDSVLKVAMLVSLAKEPKLEIDEDSMQEAIKVCEKLIGNVRKTTLGKKGKSVTADQKAMVLHELVNRDNHMISREQLLKKYWMHMGAAVLDDVCQDLIQAGVIRLETMGNQIMIVMPEKRAEELKRFFEGKNK